MLRRTFLTVFFLSAPLFTAEAQVAYRQWVVTYAPVPPPGGRPTSIYLVDSPSGAISPLGNFAADALEPYAMAYDRVSRELILASRRPTGSEVFRLRLAGTSVIRQRSLGSVPGRIRTVAIADPGHIYATVDGSNGGLWEVHRTGAAPPRQIALIPDSSVAVAHLGTGSVLLVAQDGTGPPTSRPPARFDYELRTSSSSARANLAALPRNRIVGLARLQIPRPIEYVFDDADTIWIVSNNAPPTLIPTLPPLPVGAVARAFQANDEALLVGDARSPFLRSLNLSTRAITTLAGPFPAGIVDVAHDMETAWGTLVGYGEGCGTQVSGGGAGNHPYQPGNSNFTVYTWNAPPNAPALLAFGRDDFEWSGIPLPLSLGSGCDLLLAPELVLFAQTDPAGQLTLPLPIPLDPTLGGRAILAQWLFPFENPLATTPGFAIHLREL